MYFDEDYTGKRYTYGLQYRPLATYNVPKDWIIGSDKQRPEFRFGTIDYARRLTDSEIESFQLTPVG